MIEHHNKCSRIDYHSAEPMYVEHMTIRLAYELTSSFSYVMVRPPESTFQQLRDTVVCFFTFHYGDPPLPHVKYDKFS